MLTIRLTRVGKKNSPAYRVVVADKRRAVKRKFIEIIGHYNPIIKPKEIVIDKDRALFWMSHGAQASDTVNNLMCNLGVLPENKKINKVYGKKLAKKAAKEEKVAGPAKIADETPEIKKEPDEEIAEEPQTEKAEADTKVEPEEKAGPENTEKETTSDQTEEKPQADQPADEKKNK